MTLQDDARPLETVVASCRTAVGDSQAGFAISLCADLSDGDLSDVQVGIAKEWNNVWSIS